ncbi:Hypothetical predicted protein [Octopus vulgaris]|uniref:Uncharacterized protein n=1 Tax=Octopus vulgaris TaxID=6645 RepID=A0AA36F5W2_OCTVU|nr:Hypothetical predicted protein [Octopus vulgaris]
MPPKKRVRVARKTAAAGTSERRRASESSHETARKHSQIAACTATARAMASEKDRSRLQIRNTLFAASVGANPISEINISKSISKTLRNIRRFISNETLVQM